MTSPSGSGVMGGIPPLPSAGTRDRLSSSPAVTHHRLDAPHSPMNRHAAATPTTTNAHTAIPTDAAIPGRLRSTHAAASFPPHLSPRKAHHREESAGAAQTVSTRHPSASTVGPPTLPFPHHFSGVSASHGSPLRTGGAWPCSPFSCDTTTAPFGGTGMPVASFPSPSFPNGAWPSFYGDTGECHGGAFTAPPIASSSSFHRLPFPWVSLNVGGTPLLTSHITLQRVPDSFLSHLSQALLKKRVSVRADMQDGEEDPLPLCGLAPTTTTVADSSFAALLPLGVDEDPRDGSVLLDVDAALFSHVLQYLRVGEGRWSVPRGVDVPALRAVAQQLGMAPLVRRLRPRRCVLLWGATDVGECGVGGAGGNRHLVNWDMIRSSVHWREEARTAAPIASPTAAVSSPSSSSSPADPTTTTPNAPGTDASSGGSAAENGAPPASGTGAAAPTAEPHPPDATAAPTRVERTSTAISPAEAAAAAEAKLARKNMYSFVFPQPMELPCFPSRVRRWAVEERPSGRGRWSPTESDDEESESESETAQRGRLSSTTSSSSSFSQRAFPSPSSRLSGGAEEREEAAGVSCIPRMKAAEHTPGRRATQTLPGRSATLDTPHVLCPSRVRVGEGRSAPLPPHERCPTSVLPTRPPGVHLPGGVVQVAPSMGFTCFRTDQGEVWTCGEGRQGQLGLGFGNPTGVDRPARVEFPPLPLAPPTPRDETAPRLPLLHTREKDATKKKKKQSCAHQSRGGPEGTIPAAYPTPLPHPPSEKNDIPKETTTTEKGTSGEYFISHVACGNSSVMAVSHDHHVFFWGHNAYSQGGLGRGPYYTLESCTVYSPVCVEAFEPTPECHIVEAYCGNSFSIARSKEGHVYTCGLVECLGLGEDIVERLEASEAMAYLAKVQREKERWGLTRTGKKEKGNDTEMEREEREEEEEEEVPFEEDADMEDAMRAVLEVRRRREREEGDTSPFFRDLSHASNSVGGGGGTEGPVERSPVPQTPLPSSTSSDAPVAASTTATSPTLPSPPLFHSVGTSLTVDMRKVVLLPQRVIFPMEDEAPTGGGEQRKKAKKKQKKKGGETTGCGLWWATSTRSCSAVPIIAIRAGPSHACALNARGEVFTWGLGYQGRLGHGDSQNCWLPRRVEGGGLLQYRVTSISCGSFHTAALTEDGALFMWGDNTQYQCGEKVSEGFRAHQSSHGHSGDRFQARHTSHQSDQRGGNALSPSPSSRSGDGHSAETSFLPPRRVLAIPHRVKEFDMIGRGVVTAVSCGRNHTVVIVAGPHYPPYRPLPLYYNAPAKAPSPVPPSLPSSSTEVFCRERERKGEGTEVEPTQAAMQASARLRAAAAATVCASGPQECVWREEWCQQGQPFLMGVGPEFEPFSDVLLPLKGASLPRECVAKGNIAYHASIALKRRSAGIRAIAGFEHYHVLDVYTSRGTAFFVAEDLTTPIS